VEGNRNWVTTILGATPNYLSLTNVLAKSFQHTDFSKTKYQPMMVILISVVDVLNVMVRQLK
jgi:hypothetical protein